MARWAVFAGLTALVLVLLLALARVSQVASHEATPTDETPASVPERAEPEYHPEAAPHHEADSDPNAEQRLEAEHSQREPQEPTSLSTGLLLANVALSQGLFLVILIGSAWYTRIPLGALGAAPATNGLRELAVGVALGVGLYLANEGGSRAAKAVGIEVPEQLRGSLAPDSTSGWIVLLGVVLPTIAVFEEFLFRAALVGAFSTGFSLSPWLLALLSSLAFALGHGAQGALGMVVTGSLGFVLAGAFVVTGSLLVVVVAHYLINALEFAVNESSLG
ncbi:metal-dependent membrane protease [Halococcus morrhuae DSM 1307]|uniref:Metal-dependent membrane protease n=1 Tax=Halococcus morrhuae DSM 1307 TaxID=931277 RepID=M0N4Q2_HALMO|nr:CPBP family intramembrane glutamic endopeptidase [Halococcus morrhuae]EMA51670.1 metal-dependent membrane protease [Halococcus morrhuae DSM 1307]